MKGFLEVPLADLSCTESVCSVSGLKYHPKLKLKLWKTERVAVNPVWVAYFTAVKLQH